MLVCDQPAQCVRLVRLWAWNIHESSVQVICQPSKTLHSYGPLLLMMQPRWYVIGSFTIYSAFYGQAD